LTWARPDISFLRGRASRLGHRAGGDRSSRDQKVTVVISNMTTGDIQVLDADYLFRLTGSGVGQD
jgi:hypothetical protein